LSDSSTVISVLINADFLILASFVLAGARALLMFRGLKVPTYRNQALGLAGIALYICFLFLWISFGPSPIGSTASTVAGAAADLGIVVVVMAWIDATVKVAKKSDPFEQDALHYSVVRYIWFLATAVPVALGLALDPVSLVISVSVALPTAVQLIGYSPYAVSFIFGTLFILSSARRSRDKTFHTHLRWFSFFLLFITTTFIVTAVLKFYFGGNYQLIGAGGVATYVQFIVLFTAAGYCLFRSAGSLALTTNQLEDTTQSEK
jgi:hypothetical protein